MGWESVGEKPSPCLAVLGSVGTSGKKGEGSVSLQLAGNKGPFPSSSIVMDFK